MEKFLTVALYVIIFNSPIFSSFFFVLLIPIVDIVYRSTTTQWILVPLPCVITPLHKGNTYFRTPNTVLELAKMQSNKFLEISLCPAFFYTFKFSFTPVLAHMHIRGRPEENSCIPCNHKGIRTLERGLATCPSTWNSEYIATCILGKSHPVKG